MSTNPKYKENVIVQLTFQFSLNAIEFCEVLDELKKFPMSNQLFRSATGIGSNVKEAQNAESKADFIHKMKIALKEADETEYWLLLCEHSKNYPTTTELQNELKMIIMILTKIVSTSKRNKNN